MRVATSSCNQGLSERDSWRQRRAAVASIPGTVEGSVASGFTVAQIGG